MKGFGVFVSKKIGIFMHTFEPRRRRILAVSVLEDARRQGFSKWLPGDELTAKLTESGRVD